jgi:hypothetical protein
MTIQPLDHERLTCSPMGYLEYVVESEQDGRVERWFVLRPNENLASNYREKGVSLPRGCRVVVDARSLRPVGVLPDDVRVQAPTPSAAGYNPYFELPPS